MLAAQHSLDHKAHATLQGHSSNQQLPWLRECATHVVSVYLATIRLFCLQVLRETGCLNGVITTDASKSDEELVAMTKNWTIVGKDLLSVVSCKEPYEWKDPTDNEWEFNEDAKAAAAAAKKFKVRK